MTPQETPLVELAELVGYSVYLLPVADTSSPRYAIASELAIAVQGTRLPEMLVHLLTGQSLELNASAPPLLRKVYLPRNVRYSLAYMRKHTRWDGTWMTQ